VFLEMEIDKFIARISYPSDILKAEVAAKGA
jgi:hypothetical protein